MAPRDISGRSTGSQNPGQFDEHEERAFAGIGYDALLTSTAGWGSSVKQESDTNRPTNPVSMAKFEFNDDDDYAAFADGRDEEESLSYQNEGMCSGQPERSETSECEFHLLHASVDSAGCARVMMGSVGIASS